MRPLCLLIICAVVLGQGSADELESAISGDVLEPGNLEFTNQQMEVLEPGQTTLARSNHSASNSNAGLPEPSTRPHFTGNTQTTPDQKRSDHSQTGLPEPSAKPTFSRSSQGPLEPSTQPHFSGGNSQQQASLQQPNPLEPSSRPHFSTSAQGPLEPSTRSHFSQSVGTASPRVRRPLFSSYYSAGPTRSQYQESENQYHHLYDHPALVTQRLNLPYTQSVWRCDIQKNNCFLRSKHNFVPFKQQFDFEGEEVALVLNIGDAARKRHSLKRRPNPVYAYSASRLESTSYFLAQYADACIEFSFYWSGNAKKHMHILQRNQEDVCIYSAAYDPADPNFRSSNSVWQDVQLQLDLRYGAAKFWIEYQFDIGEKRDYYDSYSDLGFIAIRNFTIGYGVCQNSKSEECDVPSS